MSRMDASLVVTIMVGAGALLLASCHPAPHHWRTSGPMQPVSSLYCPDRSGDLRKLSASADGRSCSYQALHADEQVTLTLVPLGGAAPAAALQPIQAKLQAVAGPDANPSNSPAAVAANSGHGQDSAHIDLPGFHLDASGNRAEIRMPGVSIDANGDKAQIHTGWGGFVHANVDAHSGGAVIRADDSGPNGIDLAYILASDRPGPTGDRAVGYIAKGPAAGPLVVASFESRTANRNAAPHGLERLVDMNVRPL